ncbi:MAG: helix-turn-helix transcriptional regulator [Phascolarctobacterium sp.]|nr:helix-turn-helix transcriptional regulator [Phascolarctobacterium sp.]
MVTSEKNIAYRIKKIMEQQALSLELLAAKTGLSYSFLADFINNKIPLHNTEQLARISTALGYTIPQLFQATQSQLRLTADEQRLLLCYKQLSSDKKELLLAFLKGCKYSYI